ncbi:MAG: hypothetical protein Tsb0021_08180 [Chlamydiales bacterium]
MKFQTRLKSAHSLVDLTPLVDVVFLLLIFFIITSNVLPLKSLNIENPELPLESSPLTTHLFVVMDAHHVIYFGSKKAIVDMELLKEKLKEHVNAFKRLHKGLIPTVVLSVDKKVNYDSFLQLFSVILEINPKVRLVYHRPDVDERV